MAEIKPVRHARPCGDFCAEIDSRVDEQYLVLVGSEGLDVPELVGEFNRAASLDLEVGSACRAAVLDAVIPDAIEGIPRGLSLGGSEASRSAGLELELTLDGLNVTCGNAGIRLDVVLVIDLSPNLIVVSSRVTHEAEPVVLHADELSGSKTLEDSVRVRGGSEGSWVEPLVNLVDGVIVSSIEDEHGKVIGVNCQSGGGAVKIVEAEEGIQLDPSL